MKYKGGKNNAGVYQRLITLMPPHRLYVEAFLGSGAILRRKRPAERSIGIELDRKVIAEIRDWIPAEHFEPSKINAEWDGVGPLPGGGGTSLYYHVPGADRTNLNIYNVDAVEFLRTKLTAGAFTYGFYEPSEVLVYLDPPYPDSVRSSPGKIYNFEMMFEAEHSELLDIVEAIPARVMLSGYDNGLYNARLKSWRKEYIPTVNRAGTKVIETVWLNFPDPGTVHDPAHVGDDFRGRWNVTKRARSWAKMLTEMDPGTRAAMMEALNNQMAEFDAANAEKDKAAMAKVARTAAAAAKRLTTIRNAEKGVTPAAALRTGRK